MIRGSQLGYAFNRRFCPSNGIGGTYSAPLFKGCTDIPYVIDVRLVSKKNVHESNCFNIWYSSVELLMNSPIKYAEW